MEFTIETQAGDLRRKNPVVVIKEGDTVWINHGDRVVERYVVSVSPSVIVTEAHMVFGSTVELSGGLASFPTPLSAEISTVRYAFSPYEWVRFCESRFYLLPPPD
tara:strand:+ start:105 stop:419 length:315 start_codon:yes stop_codon:yes gene_type:complete